MGRMPLPQCYRKDFAGVPQHEFMLRKLYMWTHLWSLFARKTHEATHGVEYLLEDVVREVGESNHGERWRRAMSNWLVVHGEVKDRLDG